MMVGHSKLSIDLINVANNNVVDIFEDEVALAA